MSTLVLHATVLPWHRLVVSDPRVPEGAEVRVTVSLANKPGDRSRLRWLCSIRFSLAIEPSRLGTNMSGICRKKRTHGSDSRSCRRFGLLRRELHHLQRRKTCGLLAAAGTGVASSQEE